MPGTKTRVALTPGQVSMETEDEVLALRRWPASLTWATTWFPGSTCVVPISGAKRIDERQRVQSRPAPARWGRSAR